MEAIDTIYCNDLGISFFWKKETPNTFSKVQLVFRDIGFLLTLNELKDFSYACTMVEKQQSQILCTSSEGCRSLLLSTPSDKIDLAVSHKELQQIQDLINETILRIELKHWVKNINLN